MTIAHHLPIHHLDDATIIAYAAGTLGEAHGFAVATHLAYCDACRSAVRQAENLGGSLLMQQEEKAVTNTCRSATLASLDAISSANPVKLRPSATNASGIPAVPEQATALAARGLDEDADVDERADGLGRGGLGLLF